MQTDDAVRGVRIEAYQCSADVDGRGGEPPVLHHIRRTTEVVILLTQILPNLPVYCGPDVRGQPQCADDQEGKDNEDADGRRSVTRRIRDVVHHLFQTLV